MNRLLIGLSFIFCFSFNAHSAQIAKIKGKAALIDLQGDSVNPGDRLYAVSPEGKHKALIQIVKLKGSRKAIGKILKGSAEVGMSLESKGSSTKAQRNSAPYDGGMPSTSRAYYGGFFGFSMDSMTVNVLNGTTTKAEALSGNGFSGKGLLDYELIRQVWFRGSAGLEMFNVSGAAGCGPGNNETCDAKINYLSFDFWGRYLFMEGTLRPWVGGGVSLLFPISKSTSALDEGSVTTTSVFGVGAGADFFISPHMYFPFQVEYGMLPKSNEVDASFISIRGGIAMPF